MNRRNFLKTMGLAASGLTLNRTCCSQVPESSGKRPNVLFIAVDDLRPQLGCYGHRQMITPNMDKLASQGTIFSRCYCQVPVCGASRASLLTGIRPTADRFVDYSTRTDDDLPGHLSLPHHFKNNGYHTISLGKVFHHQNDSLAGWSERPWRPANSPGGNWRNYLEPENIKAAAGNNGGGPAYEIGNVSDDEYFDGKIAKKAIDVLRKMKSSSEPFFLAMGMLKPHLPFNAPKKYWDMYKPESIKMADNPFRPKDAPDSSMHNFGELRQYAGIPAKGPLPDELNRKLVHGYYASTTYTDALIGRILDELDRLRMRDNTVVVLWGDHGWNLGEHGLWCKHCNYNTSLNAPLIISAPGYKGSLRCSALTEFVDIYPTLCELAGLDKPAHLHGKSIVPLLNNPDEKFKKAVFSRFYKGESVRTEQYLYTEWLDKKGYAYARMLYDHYKDPKENINIAEKPENKQVVARLSGLLKKNRTESLKVN